MKFSIFSKFIAWFKKIFGIYHKKGSQFEIYLETEQGRETGVVVKEIRNAIEAEAPTKLKKAEGKLGKIEKREAKKKEVKRERSEAATIDAKKIIKEEAREERQVVIKEGKKGTLHIQHTGVDFKGEGKDGERKGGKGIYREFIDKKEEGYREEKKKREVVEKKDGKKLEGEKERKKKRGKPYKKKPPTEPVKVLKKSTGEKQKAYPPRQKKVDLGKRRQVKQIKPTDISAGIKTYQERKKEKLTEHSTRVMAPFVELDIDNAKTFLVIPKQRIRLENFPKKQLAYKIHLNDEVKELLVETVNSGECLEIAEKRIELEKPIQNFEVIFPSELGNRTYRYKHQDDFIYVFIAVGNNLGRMHYLYDINGNINPLPQKEIWILLKEDLELGMEADVIGDIWVWENYGPLCVNLKNVSKLVVKDRNTNEEKVIPCESTFSMDSEEVVYDDFGEQSPIFTGNSIEIEAPIMNEEGWRVWIQNKQAVYKIVSDNWSGKDPLKLKLDRDIPCECGEFQVDICEQNGESVATLFFRYIPSLRLNYPRGLITPDFKEGHKIEKIEVLFRDPGCWEIETSQQVESTSNGYEIYLPSEKDTLKFSISKKGKPETKSNFRITIPRLKWRTSRQADWIDRPFYLKRSDLIPGENFNFFLRTSTSKSYNFLMVLEAEGRKIQQQRLLHKGKDYLLELNQFYDTLKDARGKIIMKLYETTTFRDIAVISFLLPRLICKFCDFRSSDKEEIISHTKEKHLFRFFEHLTLEELRKYDSSLPHKIYKCLYCGFYVREDDPMNPTSSICSHIEKNCLGVNRSKGPPRKSFLVINNIDEIRKNVLPNLPNYQKCKLCGKHITENNVEVLFKHLVEHHEDEIYKIEGG